MNNVELKSTKKQLYGVLMYLIGITAAIFLIRGLHIKETLYILLIIIPINILIRTSSGKKITFQDVTNMTFWMVVVLTFFKITGVLFGVLGILILMIGFTLFLVVRAVTSKHFKDSLRDLQPSFNNGFKRRKK